MAGTTLKTLRDFHQVLNVGIGFNLLAQLGNLFKRLGECDVSAADRRGNQLGNSLYFGVRHLQGPADVLYCCPGRKGSEGNDLANRIASVEVRDVIDYIASASNTKVDIDIGHRDAARVKETLEDEVIV